MTHLFYYSTAIYRSSLLLLDEAESSLRSGEDVAFLTCDGRLAHFCFANVSGSPQLCRLCRWMQKEEFDALSRPVEHWSVRECLTEKAAARILKMEFEYETVQDINAIHYRDVDIGYAALSHYICCTRNHMPEVSPEFRRMLDGFLRTAVFLTEAIDGVIASRDIAKVTLYNARTFDTRPVLRRCVAAGVETRVIETLGAAGSARKVFFKNSLPHDVTMQGRRIRELWSAAIERDQNAALETGRSFFEKRRAGVRAGDRVYVGGQRQGRLPECWNDEKRNIVIFNSSEDEFASIDAAWDALKFRPTQVEGIRKVLSALLPDHESVHVYLRIHPNLSGVKYRYHTELYELEREYPNITVISPDSPVSTYTLIDRAEKVVVFGSTVGIEAAYWGKPVILLGPAYYRDLGACYIPEDEAELKRLLLAGLAKPHGKAPVMYGYSIMGVTGVPLGHFDYALFWPDRLLGKIIKSRRARLRILGGLRRAIELLARTLPHACARVAKRTLRDRAKITSHFGR